MAPCVILFPIFQFAAVRAVFLAFFRIGGKLKEKP